MVKRNLFKYAKSGNLGQFTVNLEMLEDKKT